MHIKNLKVRPKKQPGNNICAPQLAAMLGCWAASGDVRSVTVCQDAAQTLFHCMRTTPLRGKQHGPTINYHLARLGKNLK